MGVGRQSVSAGSRGARCIRIAIAGLLLAGVALAELPMTMTAPPIENDTNLHLRFTTPAGRMYLHLLRDRNGPAELPVKDARVTALQVATIFEAGNVLRVEIRGMGADQVIYPVSSHAFELPADTAAFAGGAKALSTEEEQLVALGELASLGLDGWTVQLSGPPPVGDAETCGCCSCGGLSCCPNAGNCLSCNPCGSCCCAGPGKPRPENQ